MLGEPENQFSLTRAALSTRGAQKQIPISFWHPHIINAMRVRAAILNPKESPIMNNIAAPQRTSARLGYLVLEICLWSLAFHTVSAQLSISHFTVTSNNTCSLTWSNDPHFVYSIRRSIDLQSWTNLAQSVDAGFQDKAVWSSRLPVGATAAFYQISRQSPDILLTSFGNAQPASVAWCSAGTTGPLLKTIITLHDNDTNGVYDTLSRDDWWRGSDNTPLRLLSTARDTPLGRLVSTSLAHGNANSNLSAYYLSTAAVPFGATNSPVTASELSSLADEILPSLAVDATNPVCLVFPKHSVSNASNIQFDDSFTVVVDDPSLFPGFAFLSGSTLCAPTCMDAIAKDIDGCGLRLTLKQVSPGVYCSIEEFCRVRKYRVIITKNGWFGIGNDTVHDEEYDPSDVAFFVPINAGDGAYTLEVSATWQKTYPNDPEYPKCNCDKRWGKMLSAWTFNLEGCDTTPPSSPPKIITPPCDVSRPVGQTATFSVKAAGSQLTYQWSHDGATLVDNSRIRGSTSAELWLADLTLAEAGAYKVRVSNRAGLYTEATASLTVIPPPAPRIISPPADLTLDAGATALFTVSAEGPGVLSYQWYKGSSPLTDGGQVIGASTSSLQITGVQTADAGEYRVLVTNANGSTDSGPARLRVYVRVAHSSSDFSGTQGYRGWYYGYSEGGSFTLMPTYSGGKWSVSGDYWTSLWNYGAHPNGTTTSGGKLPVEQWAIRRWVASTTSVYQIRGTIADADVGAGDGVIAYITAGGSSLATYNLADGGSQAVLLDCSLTTGSALDFSVAPKASDWTDGTTTSFSIYQLY